MADPYCSECAKTTGGCSQHNGSGIYVIDQDGARLTHVPMRVKTQTGWFYYLGEFIPIS